MVVLERFVYLLPVAYLYFWPVQVKFWITYVPPPLLIFDQYQVICDFLVFNSQLNHKGTQLWH
jgi:hypothetical protein